MMYSSDHESKMCQCDQCQGVHWPAPNTGPVPDWAKEMPRKLAENAQAYMQRMALELIKSEQSNA